MFIEVYSRIGCARFGGGQVSSCFVATFKVVKGSCHSLTREGGCSPVPGWSSSSFPPGGDGERERRSSVAKIVSMRANTTFIEILTILINL